MIVKVGQAIKNNHRKNEIMKLPWFKRIGIFFMPVRIPGWLILMVGIAYAVYVFFDIDSRSHSASDTLRPFFITLFMITAVYTLIAWLTSGKPQDNKT